MSTPDQQERGPLTRKQLREIRMTGSTPVISEADAAAAQATAASPDAPEVPPVQTMAPEPQESSVPAPAPVPAADESSAAVAADSDKAPLTRRQVREQERVRTASVTVVEPEASEDSAELAERVADVIDDVASSARVDAGDDDDIEGEVSTDADADVPEDERATVSPVFGVGVLGGGNDAVQQPFRPSFDELLTVGGSNGAHTAPNALIYTPSAGEGSLSGPVASTGEILVTGSYELPRGIGSQGHAHGTTDGKDVDAVLIDGELPATASPTPIAASSAISTIKTAGEVIRPPAPDKGNKIMLILAITAGGLALALGVALIFAFTTNVF